MIKLPIEQSKIDEARDIARQIVNDMLWLFKDYSSSTIERTVARFFGIDGVNSLDVPLPNVVIDKIKEQNLLEDGFVFHFCNAAIHFELGAQELAEKIANEDIDFKHIPIADKEQIYKKAMQFAQWGINKINEQKKKREDLQSKYPNNNNPFIYVIVATGNIYEDVPQAKAAMQQGADIVAVIRSTAQSLLDYVPYGPTTEGFGGTYATQENFKIMRAGLDEIIPEQGRYLYLTNYASGLCMPEIAAMAAFERLDVLLNDALYGILFRDINPKRTLLDQYFSRMINAYAGILINTGEDNYLTTSDAIEKAHTVTASQLINEQFALITGLDKRLMGLGHAYEINPEIKNSFLYELSHALLARTIFPEAPLKYMPPTKHMDGNIFRTFMVNSMFNFAGKLSGQSIQLLGMLTEAIHTPFLQDRFLAIENAKYTMNAIEDLANQIEIKKDSFIVKRANQVLDETIELLKTVEKDGLFNALANGVFADIKRPEDKGKGLDGVFKKSENYLNPVLDYLKVKLNLQ